MSIYPVIINEIDGYPWPVVEIAHSELTIVRLANATLEEHSLDLMGIRGGVWQEREAALDNIARTGNQTGKPYFRAVQFGAGDRHIHERAIDYMHCRDNEIYTGVCTFYHPDRVFTNDRVGPNLLSWKRSLRQIPRDYYRADLFIEEPSAVLKVLVFRAQRSKWFY